MSAFVWLDYSEREQRKMLDVVDLFREHDICGQVQRFGQRYEADAEMFQFLKCGEQMILAFWFGPVIGVVAWIEARPSFPITKMDYTAIFKRRTETGRPASSMRLSTASALTRTRPGLLAKNEPPACRRFHLLQRCRRGALRDFGARQAVR